MILRVGTSRMRDETRFYRRCVALGRVVLGRRLAEWDRTALLQSCASDKKSVTRLAHGALMLCVALFVWHPAEAARHGSVPSANWSAAAARGASFAIADFDGDALPDFARVQSGATMALRTNYSIQFDFSLGNTRSFAVLAPAGGLQLALRDVNGDSFLDLIVSTELANEPVAVLLNDGRGNFSLQDARAFSATIWQTQMAWSVAAVYCGDPEAALAGSGWVDGLCAAGMRPESLRATAKVFIFGEELNCFVVPREIRGRAPPVA